jgi:hypothetical protein
MLYVSWKLANTNSAWKIYLLSVAERAREENGPSVLCIIMVMIVLYNRNCVPYLFRIRPRVYTDRRETFAALAKPNFAPLLGINDQGAKERTRGKCRLIWQNWKFATLQVGWKALWKQGETHTHTPELIKV